MQPSCRCGQNATPRGNHGNSGRSTSRGSSHRAPRGERNVSGNRLAKERHAGPAAQAPGSQQVSGGATELSCGSSRGQQLSRKQGWRLHDGCTRILRARGYRQDWHSKGRCRACEARQTSQRIGRIAKARQHAIEGGQNSPVFTSPPPPENLSGSSADFMGELHAETSLMAGLFGSFARPASPSLSRPPNPEQRRGTRTRQEVRVPLLC